ncbi:MAG: hypothetical protein ACI9HK_000322 [Pirellulaceae bacterium]|jgi:hypothetical protein
MKIWQICFCVWASVILLEVSSPLALGQQIAGVEVDATGVLKAKMFSDPSGQLTRQRMDAARGFLTPELMRVSPLRKVSLNRLEAAVVAQKKLGQGPSEPMKNLAGLTRISHVFFFPDTNDIVIAGPAEGFWQDISGRAIGVKTGQAVLQLEDLVVALRTFGPRSRGNRVVSVSIDSTPEGLKNMQQFLNGLRNVRPNDAGRIAQGLFRSLGQQNVTINGVSAKSHMAQVLVEADYRMKLIGIALERPPVKLTSYVERVNPRTVAKNALQRWYFMPHYECVKVSQDGLAMELVGNGVKLVGEDEKVEATTGKVQANPKPNKYSQQFVEEFTRVYPELAAKSPVYGQLRDMIDLLVASAFIRQQGYFEKAGWDMPHFGDERVFKTENHQPITKADPAVNVIWKGNVLMTPIGGGVIIEPQRALQSSNKIKDEDGKLQSLRKQIYLNNLKPNQWWWD